MMFQKNINKHSLDWLKMSNYPHRVLIVEGSGFRKTKELINLINEQPDDNYSVIDKIYLHIKGPNKAKHQVFINKYKNIGLENLKDPKGFYSFLK